MIGRWLFLRDARLSPRARLVLAALVLFALAATLPMRLALAWVAPGQVAAREAAGTIWSGALYDLRVGALALGDVNARLLVLPLLVGRAEMHVERPGPAGDTAFSANGSGGAGWARLTDVNGSVPLGDGFGTIPATTLGFTDFRVSLAEGRCREAGGRVSLILSPLSELMTGPIALSGNARCDRGALYVPMTGPSGMERLLLRLEPDGKWKAELVLAGLPVEISTPLLESGFSARPGGIGITATGTL